METEKETEKANLEKLEILQYRVAEHKLAEIWKVFAANDLEPILIKGWAAASYYPKPFKRHLGDFDCAVSKESFPKALQLVESEKLTKVDLHESLRHLDIISWTDLFENSRQIECQDVKIRVLRSEDHLRVLAVHWLTDGGEYFEKLWDIFYLIENRSSDFDWERCLGVVDRNRRRWVIITIGLAHKYLGLSLKGLSFASEAKDIPAWMTEFLERQWKTGFHLMPLHVVFGNKKEFCKQIKKRFPPNPIQATIEMEGSLDSKYQFPYQLGSIIKRIIPSLRRISGNLFGR